MFSNIGSGEIIVILIVLLFLFGGKKLPELARGLGESSRELKNAKKEVERAIVDVTSITEDRNDTSSNEEVTKGGETNNA